MAEYLVPKGYPNELVEKLLGAAFIVESSFHEEDDAFVLLAEAEGLHPGHDYIMHGVHAVVFRARFAARHDSRLGRFFCVLSRLMSLAYRQVSFVPFGAKSSQNLSPDTSWFHLTIFAFYDSFLCG